MKTVADSHELQDYLRHNPAKVVYVSTKVRKNWLLRNEYVILNGKHYGIRFINCHGGVWTAALHKEYSNG